MLTPIVSKFMSKEPGGGEGRNVTFFKKVCCFFQRRISSQGPRSQMKEGNAKVPTSSLKNKFVANTAYSQPVKIINSEVSKWHNG